MNQEAAKVHFSHGRELISVRLHRFFAVAFSFLPVLLFSKKKKKIDSRENVSWRYGRP